MKTAQQIADNWASAMQSPTTAQKYKQGVQSYQGNPMQLAAAPDAQQRYAQGTADAVNSGRMARKLQAVPVDRWRNNAVNVGSMNLTSGATKAKPKVLDFANRWAPIYAQASQAAHSLPKGGKANAMARVSAVLDVLMAAKGT